MRTEEDPRQKGLEKAVEKVLKAQGVRTRDLGGFATTRQFTQAVIDSAN